MLMQLDQSERALQHMVNLVDSVMTQKSYYRDAQEFLTWVSQHSYDTPVEYVSGYKHHLTRSDLADATINRKLTAVRKFFEALSDLGHLHISDLTAIKRVKNLKKSGHETGQWLTEDEARALLETPDIRFPIGKRDRALLAMLLGAALRVSEVVNLRWKHIRQVDGQWVLYNIKRKHHRTQTIPLADWVVDILFEYSERLPDDEPVFVRVLSSGHYGDALTTNGVRYILKQYGDLAPHDLRRTWAKIARDNGASLQGIQELLGHSSLTTTQHYLDKLSINNTAIDKVRLV